MSHISSTPALNGTGVKSFTFAFIFKVSLSSKVSSHVCGGVCMCAEYSISVRLAIGGGNVSIPQYTAYTELWQLWAIFVLPALVFSVSKEV